MKKRRHHRWRRWALAGGFAAGLTAVALIWRAGSRNAINYETVLIERGPIQSFVTTTGTLNAVVDVQVGSQVSGDIKELYADFNTKVKKSQLVALIDPAIFQSQVRQAEATARAAHMAVVAAEAQIAKSTADVSAAVASGRNMEAVVVKDTASAINARNQWEREARSGRQEVHVVHGTQLEVVPVTLGISDGKYTAITSGGLEEGQRIVSRFITKVASGSVAAQGVMPRGPSIAFQ